jgi:hypothetical protein
LRNRNRNNNNNNSSVSTVQTAKKSKSVAMPVMHSFVSIVIGVMNFKPIMRLGCVIVAIPSYAVIAKTWINVMIVVK